ncbi:DUF4129 domain-containing protein [Mycobacterium sp. EPa45]|uniref:DUF4129 domain-containing protein n=1 Tax=Mycobacterium sp. EPa45 TaxID=1545728 RepID=UPI000641D0C8|nr:DUF4129 domain-containing protein [Mycobacterium sp. EPa45]AKK27732.1 hypothetical protein AB431_14760 [Mycobacterium sp. EPa45]
MTGTKHAKMRAAALIALVLLLGIALRGRVPGAQPAARAQPGDSTGSLLGLLTLVLACLLVIIVSIVAKLRDPQRAKQATRSQVPGGGGGAGVRQSWRFVSVIAAAILAWLLLAALFAQLSPPQFQGGPPPTQPGPAPTGTGPPGQADAPPPPAPGPGAYDPVFWYLVASFAALLVVMLIGALLLRARERRNAPGSPSDDLTSEEPTSQGPGSLALAAARGLAEVGDLSREPREAIIACYAAMEHALADAPGAAPQESDTPSEVLARAVEHEAIHAGSATELVTLFAEARFSTHVMNEGHREVAERALRLVLDELRSPV